MATILRYGPLLCTLAESGASLSGFRMNVGEDTWIESRLVDADGNAMPLDDYALTATLAGAGAFAQSLDNTEILKVNDAGGVNLEGRFRWRAHGALTTSARRNVRLSVTLSGGAGNVRAAHALVQVES